MIRVMRRALFADRFFSPAGSGMANALAVSRRAHRFMCVVESAIGDDIRFSARRITAYAGRKHHLAGGGSARHRPANADAVHGGMRRIREDVQPHAGRATPDARAFACERSL
jgi:hypothetical protein